MERKRAGIEAWYTTKIVETTQNFTDLRTVTGYYLKPYPLPIHNKKNHDKSFKHQKPSSKGYLCEESVNINLREPVWFNKRFGLQTRKASKPAPTTIVRSLTIDLCVENLQTPCRYQFTLFL